MKSQITFTIIELTLAMYAISDRLLAAWLKRGFLLTLLIVGVFTWWPAWSTRLANAIGIGRGVDLLVYLALFGVLFALLSTHIRIRKLDETITKLARSVALRDVEENVTSAGDRRAS